MKRIVLLCALMLSLLLALTACGGGGEPKDTTASPTTPPATTPPTTTAPAVTTPAVTTPGVTTTYSITFMVNGERTVVETPEGEIPVFTGSTDIPMNASTIFTFAGWNNALVPATEDAIYVALYEKTARLYPVHFRAGDTVLCTIDVPYGTSAVYPNEFVYNGQKIAFFMNTDNIRSETWCDAVFSEMDGAMIEWAYEYDLAKYTGTYEGNGSINTASSAMLYLILNEHDAPHEGVLRDRALAHLRSIITGGQEPGFNAGPFWHYAAVSMSIAVARHTPTLWNNLTADEQERLTFLMECYAILTCFVSDDENTYKTGPALTGNFAKTWNPNHRMAMILPIVASTAFFSADNADGASKVNEILLGFDHDTYIAKATEYGFTRILYNWTTEGCTLENGTVALGAKELMMNGGNAYICHADKGTTSNNYALGSAVGSGVGVRTVYTYAGYGLDNLPAIVNKLYEYNYSGGAVISDTSGIANGVNAAGQPYAYIIDGSKSPVHGEIGMMKELLSSDGAKGEEGVSNIRSSTSYCTHDFVLVVESVAALRSLGLYDPTDYPELFRLMWVGNTDLVYKNEIGYRSYSLGSDKGVSDDSSYPYYLPWKAWWNANYKDSFKITRPITYLPNGGSIGEATLTYEQNKTGETVITLPIAQHEISSFAFIGWYLDSACTLTSNENLTIANGKLIVKAGYFEAITLYAAYDIPASVGRGSIVVCLPSAFGDGAIYNGFYYDIGTDVQFTLPTLSLPDGYEVIGWYLTADFSGDPIKGDSLTISAATAALREDIKLYPKIRRVYYEQAPDSLLDTSFSNKPSTDGVHTYTLEQELASDGSVLLSKYKGEDGYFRVEGMTVRTGYLTVEVTLYKDATLPFVANGFRFRPKNGSNTPDSVSIASSGAVSIGGIAVGTVTETPQTFRFVFREQADGVGYDIDFYVDGVYVATSQHDIINNSTKAEIDITDIAILHWYFAKGNTGSLHIEGLRVIDGLAD